MYLDILYSMNIKLLYRISEVKVEKSVTLLSQFGHISSGCHLQNERRKKKSDSIHKYFQVKCSVPQGKTSLTKYSPGNRDM